MDKIINSMKKRFDGEPLCNEEYLKSKTKSYEGKSSTNFHGDKLPTEGSQYIFVSIILIDSVLRSSRNYYPWVFLREWKRIVKKDS